MVALKRSNDPPLWVAFTFESAEKESVKQQLNTQRSQSVRSSQNGRSSEGESASVMQSSLSVTQSSSSISRQSSILIRKEVIHVEGSSCPSASREGTEEADSHCASDTAASDNVATDTVAITKIISSHTAHCAASDTFVYESNTMDGHSADGRVICMGFPSFDLLATYSPNNGSSESSFLRRRVWDRDVEMFFSRAKGRSRYVFFYFLRSAAAH